MKGVILAGGTATRMYPLTKMINKHILPIAGKPMIYYAIEKLVSAGIQEILVVTGIQHVGDVIGQLGDGRQFNCNLTYKVQEKAGGIAEALSLAENFAAGDNLCVILGDNIFTMNLDVIHNFKDGATIFLKKVKDPQRFGVAEFTEKMSMYNNQVQVISIEEKPTNPKSDYAVTGIYLYDNTVFDRIRTLKYSDRGEMEVTDLNNSYLQENNLTAFIMPDDTWWSDAGTLESYEYVNVKMAQERNK
jgi:glucose-1-phosphate thymidylyltransferase